MAHDYTKGCYKLEKGEVKTLEENEVDWEEIDQEIFDMGVLDLAKDLDLYRKVGDDFVLTELGRKVTEERQQMTAVEARALIRETMRRETISLRMEEEDERTPTEQDPLS